MDVLEPDGTHSGTVAPWNSPNLVSLDGYSISRSPEREDITISLRTYASDYATFVGTVLGLDAEITGPTVEGVRHATTLRQAYFPTDEAVARAVQYPILSLANGIGLALLVFTGDGKVILSRRGASSRARPGQRDVSVVEGFHSFRDAMGTGRLDAYAAAIRGCREELGITVTHNRVRLLAFGVDMDYYQWNFFGLVDCDEPADQVVDNQRETARDWWEGRLEPLPANPETVFESVKDGIWDTGLATIYLSFCTKVGIRRTREAARRVFGTSRLGRRPWAT